MGNTKPAVLFVGDADEPTRQSWEARLRGRGFQVDRTDDVFTGLARLGRSTVDPRVVIVQVDFLCSADFEFFELVSRYHRRTAAYAHGGAGPRIAQKLQAALAAGAREVLTAERFDELLEDWGNARDRVGTADATEDSEASRGPESAPAASGTNTAPAASNTNTRDESQEDNEEASPGPVSVPWRRVTEAPARTPPGLREPLERATPESGRAEQNDHAVREDAANANDWLARPLLSPEELALLTRDEPAANEDGEREEEEDAR